MESKATHGLFYRRRITNGVVNALLPREQTYGAVVNTTIQGLT